MKKTNLLALGAVLAFGLASCGGIDYSKPFLSGEVKVGGLPCTIDIYLKENNGARFDFEVTGKVPEGMPDFGKTLDMDGTYEVKGKDYIFTFDAKKPDGSVAKVPYTAKYVEGKDYTHELSYVLHSDVGDKTFAITGNLPL